MANHFVAVAVFMTLISTAQAQSHSSSGNLACGSTVTGDTTGAAHNVGSSSGEHYYRLAVTAPREYTFSTCEGSAYDTRLRLYSGNHLEASSVELANIDDACGLQSRIVMTLQPGAYTVIVEGYSANEGVTPDIDIVFGPFSSRFGRQSTFVLCLHAVHRMLTSMMLVIRCLARLSTLRHIPTCDHLCRDTALVVR